LRIEEMRILVAFGEGLGWGHRLGCVWEPVRSKVFYRLALQVLEKLRGF
jgi:hypothetical protein